MSISAKHLSADRGAGFQPVHHGLESRATERAKPSHVDSLTDFTIPVSSISPISREHDDPVDAKTVDSR